VDEHSAKLLNTLVAAQATHLRSAIPVGSTARGASLAQLVELLIDSAERQAALLMKQLESSDATARPALGRKLTRCRARLDVAHLILADYAGDVLRQDLPTGLLCLIDTLVSQLLPASVDPLVHLDEQRMYSTLSLNGRAAWLLNDKRLAADVGVVVFNLPALDPGNVLYAPILAHEVAHTLVSQADLVGDLYRSADLHALNKLFVDELSRSSTADPAEWKQRLSEWIQELLCDAIATRLTGPSFLLASAAFLPATSMTGSLSSHPFPVDRLDLCASQLRDLGWGDHLAANFPSISDWLNRLSAEAPAATEPQETFLRKAVTLLSGDITKVAGAHIVDPLRPEAYDLISAELNELIAAGVPPSRLTAGTPSSWDLVLAGWQTAIAVRGDTPMSITAAAEDRPFNGFLLKSLEIAKITEIWDES
jgi:hypothetical protein